MINFIWMFLMVSGLLCAAWQGNIALITKSSVSAAQAAVNLAFQLTGVMCLWLGIMKIAQAAGIVHMLAALLAPIIRRLFPSIPKNHPALGAIVMTVSANMLGLGNAVTPLGIKAMQELQTLNPHRIKASPAMCTLLALCTTGFTLLPATVIALRAAAGSVNPSAIVASTMLASMLATFVALVADRICRALYHK